MHRVELARLAAEEPPEVVEPPAVRPAIERPGRSLLVVRRQVPLAERRGRVPVLLQDPRERRAVLRQIASSRGTRRRTPRSAEPDRVMVAPGEHRRARRRAERGDVEPVVLQPASAIRVKFGVLDRAAERARVPNPASSISTSSTFGAPSGGSGSADRSSNRAASPRASGSPCPKTAAAGSEASCGRSSGRSRALLSVLSSVPQCLASGWFCDRTTAQIRRRTPRRV